MLIVTGNNPLMITVIMIAKEKFLCFSNIFIAIKAFI